MIRLSHVLSLCLFFSLSAYAKSHSHSDEVLCNIMEKNNMNIPVDAKNVSNINQETFNRIIDELDRIYTPIVKAKGAELWFDKAWDDGTVNAYAIQKGRRWEVHMFGGMARHRLMTPDGFALVVCHELGHHLGGAPKGRSSGSRWASNEGQSDYFASLKCLRKYMENDNNEAIVARMNVSQTLRNNCEKSYTAAEEVAICIRMGMAGQAVTSIFSSMRGLPPTDFNKRDPRVVSTTSDAHPEPQCRLDTYVAGALCTVSENIDVSDSDVTQGTCTKHAGFTVGLRPRCWYKPTIE